MGSGKKPAELGFLEHLAELRQCLIGVALALALGFAFSVFLSRDLLNLLVARAGKLVFLRPAEPLMVQLKIALVNGIIVSMPVILWQMARFLWPALYPRERRILLLYLPFGFLLFCAGLAFGYLVVVEVGYKFLVSLAPVNIQQSITMDNYLSFVLSSTLACALVFMLPVVVLILTRIGLLKTSFLWRQQKTIVIGLMIVVAVITPTVDAVSMLLVFLPLFLLFELSILLAAITERRAARRERQAE